jgi:hypothetical protein
MSYTFIHTHSLSLSLSLFLSLSLSLSLSLCLNCFLTRRYTHIISGRLLVAFLLLFRFEPARALTSGSGPSPRYHLGFAATPDGMLYVFGGEDHADKGNEGDGGGQAFALCYNVLYYAYIHTDALYCIDIHACVRACLYMYMCRA